MTQHVLPQRVEIYDTTLRDGSQLEGISLTVEDKLRIAEQLDWLGVDYIEAGWPGANPKDDELFRRAEGDAALDLDARRLRVDAARQGQGRQRRHAAPPRGGQRRHRVHRRQVVGLPRARGARHHARRGRGDGRRLRRIPSQCGHGGALRRRALLRRLQAQSGVRVAHARGGGDEGCLARRAVRHQWRRIAARGRAHRAGGGHLPRWRGTRRGPSPRRRRHRSCERDRRRARWCHAGTRHDQRLRRAHRELQPHRDHPEPVVEDGHPDDPRGSYAATHTRRASRRRAREHAAQPASRVRRALGVRAQGRFAHECHRQAARRVRASLARRRRQRHALRRFGARRQVDARAQGEGARPRARRSAARRRWSSS